MKYSVGDFYRVIWLESEFIYQILDVSGDTLTTRKFCIRGTFKGKIYIAPVKKTSQTEQNWYKITLEEFDESTNEIKAGLL